jgi:hypothetical protein
MNRILLIAGTLLLSGSAGLAQVMDHATMNHGIAQPAPPAVPLTAPQPAAATPTQPGQAAYAALGEVVRILQADPQTDWSTVDVDALRNHLVDMDDVTMRARVTRTSLPNGAIFHVAGEGPVIGSIQRMTKSHFAEADFGRARRMKVQPTPDGADVAVVADSPAEAAQISGLGFFGILTMGAHHQPHHLMMARGVMRH